MKKKLIIYELNELPYKLFKNFITNYPNSNLAKIYNEGSLTITDTDDGGELHPWSTWPTFHMGVNNKLHNYQYLNQDVHKDDIFRPIWDELLAKNFTIGIYGLLQSRISDVLNKKIKFYIPDTFNSDSKCIPEKLNPIQNFNDLLLSNYLFIKVKFSEIIFNYLKLLKEGFFK